MRRLYTAHDVSEAGLLESLLQQQGIPCTVRYDSLSIATGEVPVTYPELWVPEEADFERARRVVEEWERPEPAAAPWTCPSCGELLEGQFTRCWHCGAERPAGGETQQ